MEVKGAGAKQDEEGAEWAEMRHGGGLGGARVSKSYVSTVVTPAKPLLLCHQFLGQSTYALLDGRL